MTYQYFISSRWRNRDAVLDATNKLRAKGKTVYCFFESEAILHDVEEDPEKAMASFEAIENWRDDLAVQKIFKTDMDALKSAEILVMLLPAGRSAHIEAGTAYGLGKKCILIGEQNEAESLYLIFEEMYGTIDEFVGTVN